MVVLCQYVHLCLLLCVKYLSVHHNVLSYGSVLLCPLLSSAVSPVSYSTSHSTFRLFCLLCVTMSTAVFYIVSTVCQYLTLYRLFVLCYYVHCCLLQSVNSPSVRDTEVSVVSVSLCLLLFSTVCPPSGSTSHFSACWSFQYDYRYLHSSPCLSVPHSIWFFSLSLYQRVSSRVSPLSVSTSHCACVVSEALWPLTSSTVSPLSDKSSHCIVC